MIPTASGAYAFCSVSRNNLCQRQNRVNLSSAHTLGVFQVELFSKHVSALRENTDVYRGINRSTIITYAMRVRDLLSFAYPGE